MKKENSVLYYTYLHLVYIDIKKDVYDLYKEFETLINQKIKYNFKYVDDFRYELVIKALDDER